MIKRAILGVLSLFLGVKMVFAACDPTLAPTYTSNLGLAKPAINSCSWGAVTNANWGIIDSSIPSVTSLLRSTQTWTGGNTYTGPTIFKGLTPGFPYPAITVDRIATSLGGTSGGPNSVAIGNNALSVFNTVNYAGRPNVAIGPNALIGFVDGGNLSQSGGNVAVGYGALGSSTQTANTGVGDFAGAYFKAGNRNTFLGQQSGTNFGSYGFVQGDDNIFIGYQATSNSTSTYFTNSAAIGSNAVVSQKNALVLGCNTSSPSGCASGTAWKVGIGTDTPKETLHVIGNLRIDGGTLLATNLSANQCVQTDGGGGLATTGSSCGSGGGGGSSLQITKSGVQITSPTASINFFGLDFNAASNGTTAQIVLNGSTTDFIHNQNTLQTGATSYPDYLYVGTSATINNLSIIGGVNQQVPYFSSQKIVSDSNLKWNSGAPELIIGGVSQVNSGILVGVPSATEITLDRSNGPQTASYIDFRNSGTDEGKFGVENSGANWSFRDKNLNPWLVVDNVTDVSSFTALSVTGAKGETVTYGITVGTMSGAGLSTCGDSIHALSWTAGTFGCQTLTGGGGGSSTNGTINAAAQFAVPYYSLQGTTTTLSAYPGVTFSTNTGAGVTISTLTVSSMTFAGPGDGGMIFTIGNSTYGVLSSSFVITLGHLLTMNSTNFTVGDGGTGGGGAGTPSAPFNSVQYNNAGAFGGSNNFQFNGTSTTIVGSMTVTSNGSGISSLMSVFGAGLAPNTDVFAVGSNTTSPLFEVPANSPVKMAESGATIGNLQIGGRSDGDNVGNSQALSELPNTGSTQGIDIYDTLGNMDLGTASSGAGGKNGSISFTIGQTGYANGTGTTELLISSYGITISTGVTIRSSTTITSGGLVTIANGNSSPFIAQFSTSTASLLPIVSISTQPAVLPSDYELLITSPSTTATAIPVFGIQADGHVISSGTAPTVSTCGTSPTMDPNSTDFAGTINTGSASPTACTLTFANAFVNVPVCVVSDDLQTSEPAITTRAKTGFTMTLGAALNSGHIFYICVGSKQ